MHSSIYYEWLTLGVVHWNGDKIKLIEVCLAWDQCCLLVETPELDY